MNKKERLSISKLIDDALDSLNFTTKVLTPGPTKTILRKKSFQKSEKIMIENIILPSHLTIEKID